MEGIGLERHNYERSGSTRRFGVQLNGLKALYHVKMDEPAPARKPHWDLETCNKITFAIATFQISILLV